MDINVNFILFLYLKHGVEAACFSKFFDGIVNAATNRKNI